LQLNTSRLIGAFRLLTHSIRRPYLRVLYWLGGIEAINRQLLRVDRVEEILAGYGASIGTETVLHGPLVIHNADRDYSNLSIGDKVHLGRLVILDLAEPLVLGDETVVSMGSTILTHSDVGDRPLAQRYARVAASVRIGPSAYLGANVTVLAGCDVGRASVVGAGAVVTRAVPDGAVVVGVPAEPIRSSRSVAPSPDRDGATSRSGSGETSASGTDRGDVVVDV
jgi:acetyltransferase-like isoleucine patch superfamily enzyme